MSNRMYLHKTVYKCVTESAVVWISRCRGSLLAFVCRQETGQQRETDGVVMSCAREAEFYIIFLLEKENASYASENTFEQEMANLTVLILY